MLQWINRINSRSSEDGNFFYAIKKITGCRPKKLSLYQLALRHSSANRVKGEKRLNNERLEYLGDAILGSVVAEYLYVNFPDEEEGFLTSMRSKIVSRQSLNKLGEALGLPALIVKTANKKMHSKSLYGNALEALIGAIYLDCGHKKAKQFVEKNLIEARLNLSELSKKVASYKGALLEWAQKEKSSVRFYITGCYGESHAREYQISLDVNGILKSTAFGHSKKRAEEAAAKQVYSNLTFSNGKI